MAVLKNLQQENEALKRKLEEMEAAKAASISFRVSEKGAVSLYGVRRFPITFYKDEWLLFFENETRIRDFIKKNEAALKSK